MTATIPADVADWIRDAALPASLRGEVEDRLHRTCPCLGSVSGHCGKGSHEQCPRTQGWHRHGEPSPETWITNSRGLVAAARGISTAVWRTGRACRWLCPCNCHTTVMALFTAPASEAPRRMSVSGGNNRIATTDRLRADDEPQPTLFDAAPGSQP
ncbi:hypothetical protein GA0070616_4383 [Micromonospora nigra]|uniref:Uncharacterized protein n=1 Tax=Micromonospora nigra TaxID=145857 RepID=A0A1C6SRB4_9ACTN|nr:DUF6248 family natural product biosynthesis protein [Micromonospora nigra]SCL32076.1 hypothetical protein GA0070616_4383 [Micromonospora nigra]